VIMETHRSTGMLRRLARAADRAAVAALVAMVVVYQRTLSPLIGRQCRFEPTCSAYFRGAVEHYGAVAGAWRGVKRICRCHPWRPGGYDPP